MFEKNAFVLRCILASAMLLVIVTVLSLSSFHGSIKFRKLIKSARGRAYEMPLVAELSFKISQLRSTIDDITVSSPSQVYQSATDHIPIDEIPDGSLSMIRNDLLPVRIAFENYRFQLEDSDTSNPLGNNTEELKFVRHFDEAITKIEAVADGTTGNWIWDGPRSLEELKDSVDELHVNTSQLPKFLNQRMNDFAKSARTEYHIWMFLSGSFNRRSIPTTIHFDSEIQSTHIQTVGGTCQRFPNRCSWAIQSSD